jgi:hypothetical protein
LKQTSPVRLRIPSFAADADDEEVAGDISEGEIHAFARKSIGTIASPYLAPFIHRRGVLDAVYGLRKMGDRFFMGISDVTGYKQRSLY